MADYAVPKNGVAYVFYGCLVSQADTKLFKSAPTLAAGDFKVSTDGGAFANLATLPTNTPGTYAVKFSLSASEMTGDNILVVASDAAGAEWCDQCWNIQTSARGIADLAYPATSGRSMVVDANGLVDANTVKVGPTGSGTAQTAGDIMADTNDIQTRLPAALVSGRMDCSVGAMAANTLTAAATAADFGAEIATAIWTDTTAGDFTVAASIGKSVMNGVALGTGLTINGYTGNTVQTGDSFARIGVAGAGLTAIDLPDQTMNITGNITGNLSGSVGSVTGAVGSVTGAVGSVTGLTNATIADQVWDEALAGHLTAGSTGEALNAAGAAGDPWTTSLPGAYGAGSAGFIIGNNIDAPISTVDTVVDAIKAKTDSLTFTVANQVDANIQSVNDVTVTGTGAAGDEWGP